MFILKKLFTKSSISVLLIFAFAITACAQDKKKTAQAASKEQTKTAAMQKVKMSVAGMTCSACQSTVKKTIKSLEGVSDVEVSLEKKFAYFTFDPQKVKVEQVQKVVNDKGFTAGKPQGVN